MAVQGNYDQVNRLCSEVANTYGWGFVTLTCAPTIRRLKTLGYEVEQLAGNCLTTSSLPLASGSLFTKIYGFQEFIQVGLVTEKNVRFSGAQAEGCSHRPSLSGRPRLRQAGQTKHDRQVYCDWQPS